MLRIAAPAIDRCLRREKKAKFEIALGHSNAAGTYRDPFRLQAVDAPKDVTA
jgi:hypothetical protein